MTLLDLTVYPGPIGEVVENFSDPSSGVTVFVSKSARVNGQYDVHILDTDANLYLPIARSGISFDDAIDYCEKVVAE